MPTLPALVPPTVLELPLPSENQQEDIDYVLDQVTLPVLKKNVQPRPAIGVVWGSTLNHSHQHVVNELSVLQAALCHHAEELAELDAQLVLGDGTDLVRKHRKQRLEKRTRWLKNQLRYKDQELRDIETSKETSYKLAQRIEEMKSQERQARRVRDTAAIRIQAVWRRWHVQRHFAHRWAGGFERTWDERTGLYYYFHFHPALCSWGLPKLFQRYGIEDPAPFRVGLSYTLAAQRIRAFFATLVARTRIRALVSSIYEKVYDPDTDRFYFYNKQTHMSSWTAPLGMADNLPEMDPAQQHKTPRPRTPIDRDSAVLKIQGMYRNWVVRQKLRALLSTRFQKGT